MQAGYGESAFLGIGGDPIIGTTTRAALIALDALPDTKAVVMVGEIGGSMEEEAADYARTMTKPVVAFIAGGAAPEGKKMGHAGAIVMGDKGSYASKRSSLEGAGVCVLDTPPDVGAALGGLSDGARCTPDELSAFAALRRQRRRIRCQIQHIFNAKFFDGGLHQRTSSSSPRAMFEVIELANDITRRAARDAGYRPQALKAGPVANAAWHRLAATAVGGERLTFLNAAWRHIRSETCASIPAYKLFQVIRHFDDALPDRLRFSCLNGSQMETGNIGLGDGAGFHDAHNRSGFYGRKVCRRRLHF